MSNLAVWTMNNIPNSEMLYSSPFLGSCQKFWNLGKAFGVEPTVVGTHMSKSINLPVVRLDFPQGYCLLRDNFHDLTLTVVWKHPLVLEYTDIYEPQETYDTKHRGWNWYLDQVKRNELYSWNGWTQEDIRDPSVLGPPEPTRASSHTSDEKVRWANRFVSPDWYHKDWSGSTLLWDGDFGPEIKEIYAAYRCGFEGFSDLVLPSQAFRFYVKGENTQCFSISTQWTRVESILRLILSLGCMSESDP